MESSDAQERLYAGSKGLGFIDHGVHSNPGGLKKDLEKSRLPGSVKIKKNLDKKAERVVTRLFQSKFRFW